MGDVAAASAACRAERCRPRSRAAAIPEASGVPRPLLRFHLGAVLVPEQVQEPVDERLPPRLPHHLRADDRVAELAWHSGRQTPAPIDRERENIGWLIDPEVLVLERPDLVGPDEDEPELALLDALGREHLARERARTVSVDLDAASVRDLD